MLVLPLWCHLLKETSQLACLLFVTLYFTLHRTLINIDAAYSRQHTCLNTKCSRLSWQAEDRAVEANKTVNRLQKDVDRIEGLSVDICTSLVNLSDVEAIRYLKPQPRTVLAPNQYNGSNICLGGPRPTPIPKSDQEFAHYTHKSWIRTQRPWIRVLIHELWIRSLNPTATKIWVLIGEPWDTLYPSEKFHQSPLIICWDVLQSVS